MVMVMSVVMVVIPQAGRRNGGELPTNPAKTLPAHLFARAAVPKKRRFRRGRRLLALASAPAGAQRAGSGHGLLPQHQRARATKAQD